VQTPRKTESLRAHLARKIHRAGKKKTFWPALDRAKRDPTLILKGYGRGTRRAPLPGMENLLNLILSFSNAYRPRHHGGGRSAHLHTPGAAHPAQRSSAY
jgi:hypothetical protein